MWKRDQWHVQYWNPGSRPHSDITDYDFENVAELIKIRYPEMAAATLSRTAPTPTAAAAQKARIRVQAGDKCVAPVKSKPKKRKHLTAKEQTGLSMAAVEWSEKIYTVGDLVQYHGGRFPIIAKVTTGYNGDLDADYTSGMVVQLEGHGVQDRLIAMDTEGRRLSIPLDYQVDVTVLGTKTPEIRSLESAIRKYSLPFTVRVVAAKEGMKIGQINIIGKELYIIDSHEDVYVKGNIIDDGWIDQSNISCIPSFLRMQFAVAVGMRDATDDEWDDYRNMFARSVRHMHQAFGRITGWPGVVIQDEGRGAANLGGPEVGGGGGRVRSPPGSPLPVRDELYQNVAARSPSPHRRRVLQSPPPSSPRLTPIRTPPLRDSSSSNENPSNVHMIQVDVHSGTDQSEAPAVPVYENVATPPPPPHHSRARSNNLTDAESADDVDVDEMFGRVLVVAEEEEQRRSLERDRQERTGGNLSTNSNTVMNLVNRLNSNANPTSGTRATLTDVNQNRPFTGPAPRAVVPPTRQLNNNNSQTPSQSATPKGPFVISVNVGTLKENNNIEVSQSGISSSTPSIRYKTLEEVPPNLGALTVEEVCHCLHLLNMDAHVPQFRKHQVDGKLIGDMKETVLAQEFKFTPFNASKLMRFARGWRPRFT